jgi:hypothetical protein
LPSGRGLSRGLRVKYTCRENVSRTMLERTDQSVDNSELRFAAVMLVVSAIILVAIIREARADGR